MSGHSKWSQIKHAKAATDKKKGQLFSKLIRQIVIAVREGGADPGSNFKLRLVMEKAREAEMPKDNIDRAIQKANGSGGEAQIEQVTYEGFGPFGTTFIVEAATDNKNRTTSNIRHIFEKHAGKMGQPGSVAWNFDRRGQILIEKGDYDISEVELAAIDAGAEDVKISDQGLEIYTPPLDLNTVKQALEKCKVKIANTEIIMEPKSWNKLGAGQQEKARFLLEALSEDEDVIAVHSSTKL